MRIPGIGALGVVFCSLCLGQDLAIRDVRVYPAPTSAPLDHVTVLVSAGKITAVSKSVPVPPGRTTLSCQGCVVVAGFWNSHIHFSEAKWSNAGQQPAAQLTRQLELMLTHSGFATVVDTGSNPADTLPLRRRIEAGEISGPRILTAGGALYPAHGVPYYLGDLPPAIRAMLPQPETPEQAASIVQEQIRSGSDIVKLFAGSYVAPGKIKPMELTIAKAAVTVAHAKGKLVFAHPSNLEGTRVAMESGVDVLAHAPNTVAGIDDKLIADLVARHMAMIPTLKLFSPDDNIASIRDIVRRFHAQGGQLLFGTDTGYLTDYDMSEEYKQLYQAGLSYQDVLAMLTTAPAARFQVSDHEGRVAVGMNADLTVLSVDPAKGDPKAFSGVQYTIRNGKVLYSAQ